VRRGTDEPLPYLQAGIQGLVNCGCDYIVIPCNTAHFWFHELEKMDVHIKHIVDSVADSLRDLDVVNTTIGVMGTQGTIELGLYQYRLNKLGWQCVVPTPEEMATKVQPAIDLIKANKIDQAYLLLIDVVDRLVAAGVSAVVLGCTEIPLAVREEHWNGVPLVNSIDSLVSSVLKDFKKDLT
jgi:aspartate racemase